MNSWQQNCMIWLHIKVKVEPKEHKSTTNYTDLSSKFMMKFRFLFYLQMFIVTPEPLVVRVNRVRLVELVEAESSHVSKFFRVVVLRPHLIKTLYCKMRFWVIKNWSCDTKDVLFSLIVGDSQTILCGFAFRVRLRISFKTLTL